MKALKKEVIRKRILDEIVATLEFLQYLKNEAKGPVQNVINREEAEKINLVNRLERIYSL